NNGFQVTDGVYACRGKFDSGNAGGLCGDRYGVCSTVPAGLMCGAGGFFGTNTSACKTRTGAPPVNVFTCSKCTTDKSTTFLIAGCGTISGSGTPKTYDLPQAPGSCLGSRQVL